jgi:RNA polymerase sigma-70 factor, ECF subfamily
MTSETLAIRLPQVTAARAPAARHAVASAASDEALIGRIAAGDRLAMKVLFARHHVRIYRFVLRLVRDAALAEDLLSEVFLDVWRQAASFEARSTAPTWLLAIARFKALSSLRRRGEEPLDEAMAAAIEDPADDPEVALHRRQQQALLRTCWAKLSPHHRDIIDVIYFQEKAIGEAAIILGVPENTVKTRLFYARKRLTELLKAAGIDRGF